MQTNQIQIVKLLSQGKYQEVLNALSHGDHTEVIPEGRISEIRGLAHYGLLDIPSAIHHLEIATTMVPLSAVAQLSLASCYLNQKFPLAAEAIYRHLKTRSDVYDGKTLCTGVAEGLTRLDLHTEALSVCHRGLLQYPESHRLNFLCGINLRQDGNSPYVTRDYFRRAVRQNPESPLYAIEYAKDCLETDDFEDAFETMRPIDPANISCVALLQRLRLVYDRLGDEAMTECCDDQLRAIYYQRQSKYS
ncbi:MAG: hypothetical protein VYA11_05535 [Planctomycetota bacterium]|nr:hypothetical protein [Planctomycetota bacterium]